ncbi:F0F1 ATP synthase subunit B [Salinicoccus halitifaciens]|uniref:F0F1 ATP synthase subunit B n=1 Tax=Salinicoccus halitifaciens TaxID=1073415 RepID=UPI001E48FC90|nr:F0F1 ATP synthase subunit B [Salinicoccus halitifaciens]MCD2138119.1 F0F1 ATP synthase subunit B [Salinicoccus halitifaciens]
MEFLILGNTGDVGVAIGSSLVLLVSFLVLLGALSYFVWKPLKNVMDERENLIHSEIDDAENRRIEAQRLQKENEELLKQTQADISSIMEDARAQATKEQETIIHDANTRANQLMANAKADVEREKAIAEINDQVAELSILIAEKMISKEIDHQDQQQLVKQYLQEAGGK